MNGQDVHERAAMRSGGGSSYIPDEEVHVNLAMADLMAYLQVVANNSQNLPLTRRDDPELGRTVSTLTADEYARKSAAFIPSDVRIIGGSFIKYGRVWDLPTSEEFNPVDGAQEPGISMGGACCNSMLKVLYDIDNEGTNNMEENAFVNPDTLFDEESTAEGAGMPSKSFDMSLTDMATAATITWTELLRKMKIEMQALEFSQVPTITSSRKFDLNQPISLVSPEFDPMRNRKRSLLIGCNYNDMPGAELKSGHDDIRSMKDYIVNVHGFPEQKGLMTILLDDSDHKHPTHMNITEAFKALSEQSQPGDSVFIQFSGHGCRALDSAIDTEAEGYDEAIIPCDFNESGPIRDTLMFKTLLASMRYGVTVTCVFDCCDTGVMVDLPYSWSTRTDRFDSMPKMSLNDDFSFVRFLKVVKTLYEMSAFTQLGNVVGSALKVDNKDEEPVTRQRTVDNDATTAVDDETLEVASLMTMDDDKVKKGRSNILNSLAACIGSPKSHDKLINTGSEGEGSKATKADALFKNSSLVQKIMNCTLTHNGEDSDEDNFSPTNTLDDDTYDHTLDNKYTDSRTFDSWDDESDTRRSPVRRKPRKHRV